MRTIAQAATIGFVTLTIALLSGHAASATTVTAASSHVIVTPADDTPWQSTPQDTPWG